jgi:ribonuclease P protein component
MGEAHVPAEQSKARQAARVSASDVDAGRSGGPEGPQGQGSASAVGLIWSIRDRSDFARLRTEGHRFRHGQLWLTWVPDRDCHPPRVAFAISRAVGGAVIRNRLRRQIRHALSREASFPGGLYLIGASSLAAAAQGPAALAASVHELVALARRHDGHPRVVS